MPGEQLGENIRRLRLSHGMTQDQLGGKLGIDRKHVSKLETGTIHPGKMLMGKLCDVFGVDEMALRFGERTEAGHLGSSVWDQMATAAWQKLPEAAKKKLLPLILAEIPADQEGPTVPLSSGERKKIE